MEELSVEETSVESSGAISSGNQLVVVHMKDGTVIKGVLRWDAAAEHSASLPHLPEVLKIRHETEAGTCAIRVADSKAVFFVKTHPGEREYEEVRFFPGEMTSNLWIQVRLADGEVLEGRTANGVSLLAGPGFWVWPADEMSNNTLVYVPKNSAVEFQVLGLASHSLK
jgi:Family of unknown function (DUF6982)